MMMMMSRSVVHAVASNVLQNMGGMDQQQQQMNQMAPNQQQQMNQMAPNQQQQMNQQNSTNK